MFTWLLLGLSVVALAYTLDRYWMLRRRRVLPAELVNQIGEAEPAVLRGVCAAQPSPLSRLVLSILDHLPWSREENAAALAVKARKEVLELERGLVILEIIVGVAPLLGLVGTVYTIIPLFGDFGKSVSGDNALMAKGIGIALNKTLLGLMVAIPTLAVWSLFNKKVEALSIEMETECDRLLRHAYLQPNATSSMTSQPGEKRVRRS